MAKKKTDTTPTPPTDIAALAAAFTAAIQAAQPPTKKTPLNRRVLTPWTPKDGSAKIKLKRKFYQHGIPVDPDMMTNDDIDLMNKVRPGVFLGGHVRIVRRRDRGIDIDYPIKTAAQRLRLVNSFGIRDFKELLARCLEEAENPAKYAVSDENIDQFA